MKHLLFNVNLFGTVIPVLEEKSSLWDRRTGVYSPADNTITIRSGVSVDVQRLTFLHKLVQAVSSLSGVPVTEEQTGMTACVLLRMLKQSEGLIGWLRRQTPAPVKVHIGSAVYELVMVASDLWTGSCVRIDVMNGTILVEEGAGDNDQSSTMLALALRTGMNMAGGDLNLQLCSLLGDAVLSMASNDKALIWLGVPNVN